MSVCVYIGWIVVFIQIIPKFIQFMCLIKVSLGKVKFCQSYEGSRTFQNGLKSTDFRVCFIFEFWELGILRTSNFCLLHLKNVYYIKKNFLSERRHWGLNPGPPKRNDYKADALTITLWLLDKAVFWNVLKRKNAMLQLHSLFLYESHTQHFSRSVCLKKPISILLSFFGNRPWNFRMYVKR